MRTHLTILLAGSAVVLAGLSGCQCCNRRPNPAPPPTHIPIGPPTTGFVPGPGPTARPIGEMPPNPVPVSPEIRNYEPPPRVYQGSYYWTPSKGNGVRLEAPVPIDADTSEKVRPKAATGSEALKKEEDRDTSPTLPVGIPQFAVARDGVAAGLKPSIDGLAWLQDAGYRTVLHIRKPGEDDAAERKLFAKQGMKYLSLEVSPKTLTPAVLEEFSKIVGETKTLFVYDEEGVLAGGLWYLYFRTVEKDSDETARMKAGRLGLKEDAEGEGKTMWAAIQKLMSERGN